MEAAAQSDEEAVIVPAVAQEIQLETPVQVAAAEETVATEVEPGGILFNSGLAQTCGIQFNDALLGSTAANHREETYFSTYHL